MIQTRPLSAEEICNKLRPILGEKIDDVYFRYTVAASKDEREDILHMLNALYLKNLNALLDKGVLLEPPREEVIDGTYRLANISYSKKNLYSFNLREQDWKRHVCITGMSGSGKTTLAFNIAESLNEHKKNFLIFDWKKSFRPLMNINSEMVVFTVGDVKVANLFKTNINKPPKGVDPKEWINVLVDLLVESFFASFGVHKVLLETLDEAFKEWGIYEGSENYPNWKHIKWRLEEKQEKVDGREAGWLESALRIATVLTFGEFGNVLNHKEGDSISVEDLLDKKVIMELNSLGNIEKKFFCEYLLTYIYKLKKAEQNEHDREFNHAIIVDEAHNIFLKKPTTFANESVTDMIYREMREYGTGLICLDQHISKISDTVKGNSACLVAFQQQLPADIDDISKLMQLQESRHYFSQLDVGEAIVKLAERYKTPFLVKIPFPIVRTQLITDDEIKKRTDAVMFGKFIQGEDSEFSKEIVVKRKVVQPVKQEIIMPKFKEIKPLKELEIVDNSGGVKSMIKPVEEAEKPFTEVQKMIYSYVQDHLDKGVALERIEDTLEKSKGQGNYTSSDIMKVINKIFSNRIGVTFKKAESVDSFDKYNDLEVDERKFMKFLHENPDHMLSTVEVYRQVGLSARKGTKVKNNLEKKGLIKIEELKYDRGWKKLIRLNHTQKKSLQISSTDPIGSKALRL